MMSDSQAQMNTNEPSSEATEQTEVVESQKDDIVNSNQENEDNSASTPNAAPSPELIQQIELLKGQLEERQNQYARLAADFENYRKRTLKDKEELEVQVKQRAITELLPVVDNFERARAQIKPQGDGEMTIHKSYQGVYKLLVDCLKRLGVAPMRPEGEEFDPNIHEAVMREPTDEHPEGTVLEELVRGYYLGDRVLRHAMVKVAAPSEDGSSSEEDGAASDSE